jgi:hypothetical protein
VASRKAASIGAQIVSKGNARPSAPEDNSGANPELKEKIIPITALIIASAALNGFEQGLISQWLRDSIDIGALPEGNKIFGVADDVIEAPITVRLKESMYRALTEYGLRKAPREPDQHIMVQALEEFLQ